jgi:hypothetical protein
MPPRADDALLQGLAALGAALREVQAPAMIIGGIAVIARGVPRQTVDVDATVWGEAVDLDTLVTVLGRHGFEPRVPDAVGFARQRQVLLLRHRPSGTSAEVSLAWLPFEREALGRASVVDFGGVTVPVALPEDLIVYKAVAWRDRDRADIERLLVLHGGAIDLSRVKALVREFATVLDDPGRVQEFEDVVTRALGDGPETARRGTEAGAGPPG